MKVTTAGAHQDAVSAVHEFWNEEACGARFISSQSSEDERFRHYREFRYRAEWHLLELVPFASTKGQKMLEIGIGMGADGLIFAQAGALYTGLDLTEMAIETTRRHFASCGAAGDFRVGNAESLPFNDGDFDFVYSHGALHHTPNPEQAFAEVHRVLKPGGSAVIMLYHKHSFNFYMRIMLYMRLRLMLTILNRSLRPGDSVSGPAANAIRGNQHVGLWDRHYANFQQQGWRYLAASNFIHHATDGPDCPYAYVYSKASAKKAFRSFSSVKTRVAHFPLRKYRFLQWFPFWLERMLASTMGWYMFIFLEKAGPPAAE